MYRNYTNKEECVAFWAGIFLEYGLLYDSLSAVSEAESTCREAESESFDIGLMLNVNWEKVVDSLGVLDFGVCPEGWRVPKFEDWATLLHYLGNHFEFDSQEGDNAKRESPEYELLFENRGDPIGFGMKPLTRVVYLDSEGLLLFSTVDTGRYLFLPYKMGDRVVGSIYTYEISSWASGYGYDRYTYRYERDDDGGFVRCIKKD